MEEQKKGFLAWVKNHMIVIFIQTRVLQELQNI